MGDLVVAVVAGNSRVASSAAAGVGGRELLDHTAVLAVAVVAAVYSRVGAEAEGAAVVAAGGGEDTSAAVGVPNSVLSPCGRLPP